MKYSSEETNALQREAAFSGPGIRYLPEELRRQVVWTKAVTAAEGHVARKARERIEDEI